MRRAVQLGGVATALFLLAIPVVAAAEKPTAADAIAEKFSQADAPKASPESPSRPSVEYEMEMLRRARAEADELKRAAQPKVEPAMVEQPAPAAAAAPVTLEAKTEAPKAVAPPSAQPDPPAAAPVAQPAPTTTAKTEPPAAPAPAAAPAAGAPPAQPAPTTTAKTEPPAAPAPAAAPAVAAPPAQPAPTTTAKTEPPAAPAPAAAPAAGAPAGSSLATVLLVLEPSDAKGPPDPIICFGDACAVSTGLESAAKIMTRAEALALKSTASETEDTCFGKTACAYRNVPLPKDAILQVLTAGSGANPKPDDGFTANPDGSCKFEDRDLDCGHPLATLYYTAWIVPEAMAVKAGAAALEEAIADGLPFDDDLQSADK